MEDEPEWMRTSTLVGGIAGSAVFRDVRAWHGATPNVSKEVRVMTNVEYAAPWYPTASIRKAMPHEIWEHLSPFAKHVSRSVNAEPGRTPQGVGVMHPLST